MNIPETPTDHAPKHLPAKKSWLRFALLFCVSCMLFTTAILGVQYMLLSKNITVLNPKYRMFLEHQQNIFRSYFKHSNGDAAEEVIIAPRIDQRLVPGRFYRKRADFILCTQPDDLPSEDNMMGESLLMSAIETEAHTAFLTSDSRLGNLKNCEVFRVLPDGKVDVRGIWPIRGQTIVVNGIAVTGTDYLPDVELMKRNAYPELPKAKLTFPSPTPRPSPTPAKKTTAKATPKPTPKPKG